MVIITQNINQKPGYKQTEVGIIPEDWEVKKLADIARIYRGASPRPIEDPRWFNEYSNVGWVRISDVTKSVKYLFNTTQYLSEQGIKHSRFVTRDNLIMSICATVGRPIITMIDICIHDGFVIFERPTINTDFLYYYLSSIENTWSKNGQTGSQMNLNTTIIGNENILFPKSLKEQHAIATALSDVDALISSLDRLIAKKRDIKQAAMQQILSGKTRLPGFSSDRSAKLGDFFELNPNKPHLNNADLVTFIRMEDISESGRIINQNIMPLSSIKKGLTYFERNDVLVAKITPCFENGKGACLDTIETKSGFGSTEFHVLRAKKNATPRYIFYQTQTVEFRHRLEAEMIGTAGQKRVPARAIIDYSLPILHSIDEQQTIATVLSDMDAEIAALEQKRDKTRALKQGMMQELLTGKTRLV